MNFELIYADPPWRQLKGGKRDCRPNQQKSLDYETLSIGQIYNILRVCEGKTLFLWTIDKFLIDAHIIAEELGYKLHARFIWDKLNGMAPAFTVRYSHEYLLWFYKSPMPKIADNMRGKLTTVFQERATKHSKKPTKAYEIIEQLYPDASKLELFARSKRLGWTVWGNEVESDITLEI